MNHLRMDSISVLLLEDSPIDAELTKAVLSEGQRSVRIHRVETREDFVAALAQQDFDIVLADYLLPSFDGMSALELAVSIRPQTPFIFVSGTLGEDVAIEALKRGATDYVIKQRLDRLCPAVRRALAEASERAERRRAESELRASEERLRLALETARLGSWEVDLDTQQFTCSELCRSVLRVPADHDHGDCDELLASIEPQDRPQVSEAIFRAATAGIPFELECRLSAPAEQEPWVLLSGRRVAMAHGPAKLVGVALDITLRKQLELERLQVLSRERQARAEAEKISRIKDEFLATLSHELRTPLNAIVGWSTLLLQAPMGPEEVREGLEVIERNSRVQTKIISDLLDMSRIISGKVQLDLRSTNLAEVVAAAIDTVQHDAVAKQIAIETNYQPGLPHLQADPERLQQVVWNLLSNAIKFTPAGGRIRVGVIGADGGVQVEVTDTGQGIPSEFIGYVFDRFRQADGSTTRKHGGLGLGLAIVKQLVEMHGGQVSAFSPGEGQGATFCVVLPRVPPAIRTGSAPGADYSRVADAPRKVRGLRVLVVDDEPDARELVRRVLSQFGVQVATAASANDAIEQIRRELPDVLISDIAMPERDGYELIRLLREGECNGAQALPAIALSAFVRAEDRQRAVEAGFQLHLPKPVEPLDLAAAIAQVFAKKQPA